MERIRQAFESKRGKAAFIPFLNAGDPNFDTAVSLFRSVLEAGADVVEVGVPYSDPLADGPVIQASALRSMHAGFQLPKAFELVSTLRKGTDKGLVLFTYFNPLLQYTPDRFFRDAASAGADGVIVPDLPFEESAEIREAADARNIALIPLVTPTSGASRIEAICKAARGFVYCVSSLGVTGERAKLSNRVQEMVETARTFTTLPVSVGFGVSTPAQAANIAAYADGVIVGSAIIRRIDGALASGAGEQELNAAVSGFAMELARALS